ncbi:alpha/beta hydrolase [Flavobacterium caeni]|uniref:Acetyl esterase/lipase n=1 Tax=Flavobacterium caeni TaxID=490189 RepID=A0A1G5CRS2_9FLAO|nr:alpha/beta hydrolase [Flavobacterium caeni]SCY04968.1 Acetyl esterase/lipase [Flavobacterium caeni]
MKRMFLLTLIAALFLGCDSDSDADTTTPMSPEFAKQILDVSYGDDPEQKMDIYLPAGRVANLTKVFLLVHGGGWKEGDKAELNFLVVYLKTNFPNHAIVNINYRLGTLENIGYPRQIQDIAAAIKHLNDRTGEYHLSKNYAMVGVSAGAHLSMLYSYRYDTRRQVKAVCSMVGPADFSDPNYEGNDLFTTGLRYFVGDYPTYVSNPALYNEVSPSRYISLLSPKTILLYGNQDTLVPESQGQIVHNKLNQNLVYNEYHEYDMGHIGWTVEQLDDMQDKMTLFFTLHF